MATTLTLNVNGRNSEVHADDPGRKVIIEPAATRRGLLACASLLVGFALFGRMAGTAGLGIAANDSIVGLASKNVAPDAVDSYLPSPATAR